MAKLTQIFFRSFLLQGFWNYAQMQNVGLFYILQPYLKRIYKDDKEGLKRAGARNLETFNSHPVMSAYAIGAMLKQEQKIAALPPAIRAEEEREYRIIRASVANTAASIGDRLFWATLKPLSLVLAFFVLFGGAVQILGEDMNERAVFYPAALALLSSLLLYNVPAIAARIQGLRGGYNGSEDDFYGLIKINWNKTLYFLKTLGQVFTILVIFYGLYVRFKGGAADIDSITRIALLGAFVVLSVMMKKLNIPNIFLYITATAVFAAASFLA